jgi:hypothetical protein
MPVPTFEKRQRDIWDGMMLSRADREFELRGERGLGPRLYDPRRISPESSPEWQI